jgi:hypothetical protein
MKSERSRNSHRSWIVGRLAIGLSIVTFFFGGLLLPQFGRQALAASPEQVQNTRKRAGCIQQMSADYMKRSVLTAKASYIAPPSVPVRVTPTRFFQSGTAAMQCNGDCPDHMLVCMQGGTFIKANSGCCAVCCWYSNPNNCSDQECCRDLAN